MQSKQTFDAAQKWLTTFKLDDLHTAIGVHKRYITQCKLDFRSDCALKLLKYAGAHNGLLSTDCTGGPASTFLGFLRFEDKHKEPERADDGDAMMQAFVKV